MKLIEAIQNIDKSISDSVNGDALFRALDLTCEEPEDFEDRVKGYYLVTWRCTDTMVGLKTIMFDDKPLAITWQSARKNSKQVFFITNEIAQEFRNYIIDSMKKTVPNYCVIDLDTDIEQTFKVSYHTGKKV